MAVLTGCSQLGGSAGHISAIVASKHLKLNMIVQDLPYAESAFNANIGPTSLTSRIQFRAHDFFNHQDVSADVFLIKSILNDWPDKSVVQIIRNLLPALKVGNHILLADMIMPPDYDESGKPTALLPVQKALASVDLNMHVVFNAKGRKLEDWIDVIQQADARLKLKAVHSVLGSLIGLIDFVFKE